MSKGIVIYTDGGARPNPGNLGWGAHGYLFTYAEKLSKTHLKTHWITNKGYIPQMPGAEVTLPPSPEAIFGEEVVGVEPIKYFDFLGTDGIGTNNDSEIKALYQSVKYFLEHESEGLEYIQVLTDSEYVRKGLTEWVPTWVKKGWVRQDGRPVANKEAWQSLIALLEAVKEKDIQLEISWVAGHSGIFGNENADWLATIAIMYAEYDKNYTSMKISDDPSKYWKVEVERSPYIHFSRLYFNSTADSNSPGRYFITHSTQNDGLFGKKNSDTSYAVIKLYEPDYVIESVRNRQIEICQDIPSVIMVRLDRLYSPALYPSIREYGGKALYQARSADFGLDHVSRVKITEEVNPAGLSYRGIEIFSLMENILQEYETHHELKMPYQLYDITDAFYEETTVKNKTKKELKKAIKSDVKEVEVKIPYPNSEQKELSIMLRLGVDLPPRNSLKKIETQKTTIKLIIWFVSDKSIKYMCLVDSDVGIGIWSNYYTDQIFLN